MHYGWWYQIWQSVDRIVMLPDAANWYRVKEPSPSYLFKFFTTF